MEGDNVVTTTGGVGHSNCLEQDRQLSADRSEMSLPSV